MVCPNCSFENPKDALFCGRCGTRIQQSCSKCSANWTPEFEFCGRCGNRLKEVASADSGDGPVQPLIPQGERRNVTVLFADMSQYTPMSEQLDPEEVGEIMQDNFADLREEVLSRDGWLAKYLGDAILAVFGAPTAHEDDPVRAVRAALAMQTRMTGINKRLEGRVANALQLHIGINTGLVFAGPTTEAGGEFTVLGDAVNTGARLQQVAAPGTVVVGETTYLATYWAFDYTKLPPLEVKGKRKKVIAYECLGPRARPLSARGIEGLQVPMLGRQRELEQLREAFAVAADGKPQIVSVQGEAGIGKSRLVRELIEELEARQSLSPTKTWTAFATTDPPEPYGVVRQLFSEALEQPDRDESEEQLATLLYGPTEESDLQIRHLDPEHRKQRLYLLASEVTAQAASETPLVVLIEDLQWADEASLDLLRFLAARPKESRLLMLFTHRPDFEGPLVWSTRASAASILLHPLSPDDMQELLRAYFGKSLAQFPSVLVDKLLQGAGGNPFYLEEFVRSLIQEGVITREEKWTVAPGADKLVVPTSLQALLIARMDRLNPEARLLLQEASVLGQSFPARLLTVYATLGPSLLSRVDDLVEGDWMETEQTGDAPAYRFHHNLVREVAYESLLVRARTALHQRAAEIIEKEYEGRIEDHVPALAEHYYRASNAPKGVGFLERAGNRARVIHANAEAETAYRRAIELLGPSRSADRARILVVLGDVLKAAAKLDEAIQLWHEAQVWFESTGEEIQIVALHRRIANALWSQARVDEAAGHLEQALALLRGNEESAEVASLFHELANQSLHRGSAKESVEWAEKALQVSQKIGAYEQAALAGTTLGVALARNGEVEAGQESIEKALVMAGEHDFPIAAGRAALNLAVLYANTDPMRAAEICQKGLIEARRIGDVSIQPWFYATLAGSLHACAADYETATQSAEMAIEIDQQLGLRSHIPVPLIVLGQIHQCHDRWNEAEQCFREALSIAEESDDPQLLYPALEGLGTLYLERGDTPTGEACMERATEILEKSGFTAEGMMLLPFFL
jgi:adenylate cyclase